MFAQLLQNHVLANLAFVLVLAMGSFSYLGLPRQQDPSINFNWIVITTVLPGAGALDVEQKVTDPLEDAIRRVQDIKFTSSNSRENISSILVRFQDMGERQFDKRIADLRREIQNAESELPSHAEDPLILEITSANAFPSALIAVSGAANDETLRQQARNIEKDIERLAGVDRVDPVGLAEPELQVEFDPDALERHGLSPGQLADTVRAFFQDLAAGSRQLGQQSWLVRLVGASPDPAELARRPILGLDQEIPLGRVAQVQRGREQPATLALHEGRPAVTLAVMKQENANMLQLVDRLKAYMAERNQRAEHSGVRLTLINDQTTTTRESIQLMQNNALIGLLLVLLVCWAFLGSRIALLTAIGIPFILAGAFWALAALGETLNVTVLLAVVIVLGMLVDDAVVVVESIYYRLQRGQDSLGACLDSLGEIGRPVLAAVLTTIAAFLPLMLLPGILGQFMQVIPLVVSLALAISLIEAFWMLPAHVLGLKVGFARPSRAHRLRVRLSHRLQILYTRLLIRALRWPKLLLSTGLALFLLACAALAAGLVRMDFFANDPMRLFYINIEMPPETPLQATLDKVGEVEQQLRRHLREGEVRSLVGYSGNMFTETEPLLGDHLGQILVGLNPLQPGLRSVDEMIEAMRADVTSVPGPLEISFLRLANGPPTAKPIQIKVRGDNYDEISAGAARLRQILAAIPGIKDIGDDAAAGSFELRLSLDNDRIRRAGLSPAEVSRSLRLLADGELAAGMRADGEELWVRVRARPDSLRDLDQLLAFRLPLPLPDGSHGSHGSGIPLSQLLQQERLKSLGNIRHYNFRRAITVEADIDKAQLDTVQANRLVQQRWQEEKARFPNLDLDFSGELDDIYEAMDSIGLLFLFGLGLMYLILGTQFKSYWQPLMILSTVPMAFTGVVLGLLATGNPMSLYTLYGVVALAGIAVNSAIVLISAANQRLDAGMSLLHATLYAARRRLIPILITSLTTIAGLFSLAAGLGGKSLIWGPVATAIVWGLAFSTLLTLSMVPLIYRLSMGRRAARQRATAEPAEKACAQKQ
jgi:multidrug efflux pump subunit AcrB